MKRFALASLVFMTIFAAQWAFAEETGYDSALKQYGMGKYSEAASMLQGYVEERPDPTAYYLMGYALYHLGRFKEADESFRQAYLIDPEFSPKPLIEELEKTARTVRKAKALKPKTAATVKPAAPPKPAKAEAQTPKPQAAPAPQAAPQPAPAPVSPPKIPAPGLMPGAGIGIGALVGLLAGLGLVFLLIGLAFYVYYALCLFLIAKKQGVSAAWTAFVPIVQIWTFVASAGKPWWWMLLLLVPLVNVFVGIYLWMLITEGLGKNRWLGLLMILPVVNLVFMGLLAFSKSEGQAPASSGFAETGSQDFPGHSGGPEGFGDEFGEPSKEEKTEEW